MENIIQIKFKYFEIRFFGNLEKLCYVDVPTVFIDIYLSNLEYNVCTTFVNALLLLAWDVLPAGDYV